MKARDRKPLADYLKEAASELEKSVSRDIRKLIVRFTKRHDLIGSDTDLIYTIVNKIQKKDITRNEIENFITNLGQLNENDPNRLVQLLDLLTKDEFDLSNISLKQINDRLFTIVGSSKKMTRLPEDLIKGVLALPVKTPGLSTVLGGLVEAMPVIGPENTNLALQILIADNCDLGTFDTQGYCADLARLDAQLGEQGLQQLLELSLAKSDNRIATIQQALELLARDDFTADQLQVFMTVFQKQPDEFFTVLDKLSKIKKTQKTTKGKEKIGLGKTDEAPRYTQVPVLTELVTKATKATHERAITVAKAKAEAEKKTEAVEESEIETSTPVDEPTAPLN